MLPSTHPFAAPSFVSLLGKRSAVCVKGVVGVRFLYGSVSGTACGALGSRIV